MTDEPLHELSADVLAALRAPAEVDGSVIDHHIQAALVHFDSTVRADGPGAGTAEVVPLAPRRGRSRWIAAAAAVLVVIGGGLLVHRLGGSTQTQTAESAASAGHRTTVAPPEVRPAESGAADSAAKSADLPAAAPAATSPPTTLPSDEFRQAQLAVPQYGTTLTTQAAGTTEGSTRGCPAPRLRAALMSIGTTVVGGEVRFIYTYVSGPNGEITTTVLVDPSTCTRT